MVRGETENGRVAVRNIRRDGNKDAEKAEKDKTLSEDQRDDVKDQIQDLTKKYETKVSDMAKAREGEVMQD